MNFKKMLKAAAFGLVLACASGVAFADDSGLSKRAMQQCQILQGFFPGIFLDVPPLWLLFWMMVVVVVDGIIDAYKK